ncbi:sperm-associated antigen 1 [Anopheles marshallii]|uniref:sperm-associated antigen 1 n=1 Tax=Anopheles marshallii TaxID=1521116 RepID=UPI00237BDC74|nr:sperm-associated antigen 1 [Anopheles marshallii]
MSNKPQRLLEKYELLLDQLDFDYIRQSNNGREVENILKVLRSGEEGYFPQLTAFAEERLKSLRPDSKLLRKEQPLATQHTMPEEQWQNITTRLNEWQTMMKAIEEDLRSMQDEVEDPTVPRIRSIPVIDLEQEIHVTSKAASQSKYIRYCDYDRWDKFDADTAMLKMDLDEERHREMVRINNQKNSEMPKIVELPPQAKLSHQEKQVIAGKLREKGNDNFRAKEFKEAVEEYDKSLDLYPTAACYNNRAIAYIKLQRYNEAIADCDLCLMIEPTNLKALLRKAQAFTLSDKKREAYQIYCDVLRLEPSNAIALSNTANLRRQLTDLPPPNAVRMAIEEVSNAEPDIDFRQLVRPKHVIKDKLPESIKQLKNDTITLVRQHAEALAKRDTKEMTLSTEPPRRSTPLIEEL